MPQLIPAGGAGALDDINVTQGQLRIQLATLVDLMRQVAGDAAVVAGNSGQSDPLSAPFTLYVNPYTGSDKFVGGSYNDYEATGESDEAQIAAKLKRLEQQRLTCGYTPQRPFKTINRAVIEAAIITSKDWYTFTDPRAHVDCVSIVLSTGVHILYNNPANDGTVPGSWGTSKDPSIQDLIGFNPAQGGVLLPRGCSLCGPDLRKTTIRPNWVPAVTDEESDYSNRRAMLKITGTGYFFGFTAMDKVGLSASHHLLDVFHFASKSELDSFYTKCFTAVGAGADLSAALTVTRGTEYEIVGPIDTTQNPTSSWDTTASASPYIFNCSVRSDYGLGGAFMDGAKVGGLKSMVCANFTGVSLQKDMSCWQRYASGSWTSTTYEQYISTDPDSIRMNPARMSRHISAINDAFIQEVSVFAIGHGVHHYTDKGGEITVTNSNSSFGGCAALSRGYKSYAFPSDRNWSVNGIKVPLNLSEKTGNIRLIYLGTIESVTSSTITLSNELAVSPESSTVPAILLKDGYSLRGGTRIWVENPSGEPWQAPLSSSAWNAATPDVINITAALSSTELNGAEPEGKRVYIRRLVDTRTPEERRTSIRLLNTSSARLPQTNFILQTDPNRAEGAISRLFTEGGSEVFAVSNAGIGEATGANLNAEITLRRSAPSTTYANATFYPAGAIVRHANKHYQASRDITTSSSTPDTAIWQETFVHMPSAYNAEDPISQEARIITIDTDTDTSSTSTTLGIDWSSIWTSSGSTRELYRASSDYKGAHALLVALGLSSSDAHAALVPRAAGDRVLDPTSAVDFPVAPSGGAATGRGNWAVEFRRPSVLRLYGHAWEWAGFLNYSKSIPAAQKDLSAQNKFTYYFTHDAGGRVVPQGSNEDGFNITPRGLENIETGATLTVENLGSSTVDQFQQTTFDALNVGNLTVSNLEITGSISGLPENGTASTTQPGVVTLASTLALTGTTNSDVDAVINQSTNVVTARGLQYWRNVNRLVSQRRGTQYVYVDPVNGEDITNIDTLIAKPPVVPNDTGTSSITAAARQDVAIKSLAAAVEYANAVFSPNEIVEFRLGPGVYVESGSLRFSFITRIRAWNFSANTYLNNDKAGGTDPFMGQDGSTWSTTNYLNPAKQPTFLTYPQYRFSGTGSSGTGDAWLIIRPLQLLFEQEATITGIAWWGTLETMKAASTTVPDSFFNSDYATVVSWRSNSDDVLSAFCKKHLEGSAKTDLTYLTAEPCIVFKNAGFINNLAFGAFCPVEQYSVSGEHHSIIESTDSDIEARGLWLIGNVNLNSTSVGYSYASTASYDINGHSYSIFGVETDRAGSRGITLNLGGNRESYVVDASNYNFTWNNIHLVNNGLAYSASSNNQDPAGTAWKTIGPAFGGFLGRISWVGTRQSLHWHNGYNEVAANRQGFKGKFGQWRNKAGTITKTKGIVAVPDGFEVRYMQRHYFLRVATTDFEPSNTMSLAYGDVGVNEEFTELNALVTPIAKGVDVATTNSISRNVRL